MEISVKPVAEYIDYLTNKGFLLGEEAMGFIQFGQQYTGANDKLVIIAIELTLKIQREFDGSFFILLLEMFKNENIYNKKQAMAYLQDLNIL